MNGESAATVQEVTAELVSLCGCLAASCRRRVLATLFTASETLQCLPAPALNKVATKLDGIFLCSFVRRHGHIFPMLLMTAFSYAVVRVSGRVLNNFELLSTHCRLSCYFLPQRRGRVGVSYNSIGLRLLCSSVFSYSRVRCSCPVTMPSPMHAMAPSWTCSNRMASR
ncbi:hypothetical protein PLICRDRAFT_266443 [Plicaturopsis crispa FD-325 SS-3]|nr:hypothetical protein PLICRDRAFT_266443 [Plicaturopsis crispa FD-325 SS-3]